MGYGLSVETSAGPLYVEINTRRRRAKIYPETWRMGTPFLWQERWSDEAELAEFVSSIRGVPLAEAQLIVSEADRRILALRRIPWWKRWDAHEAKQLRVFRSF